MEMFWFLPTHGDGRYLGTSLGGRAVNLPYLKQIAGAIDDLGFQGALLPTGRSCEDAWVVAASDVRYAADEVPGRHSAGPDVARAGGTDDGDLRSAFGRPAADQYRDRRRPVELAGDGLHLSHDERYRLTDESLTIWRNTLSGIEEDFAGEYLQAKGTRLIFPALQHPYPPLYFGGSSDAALDIAARHVDVYLTWGEPPAQVAEKIASVRPPLPPAAANCDLQSVCT